MPVDTRFYASLGALTLEAAAELTGAELSGDPKRVITGIASASEARAGDLAFLDAEPTDKQPVNSDLDLIVTTHALKAKVAPGTDCLLTAFPRSVHSRIAQTLYVPRHLMDSGSALVSPSAKVHRDARIGPGAVIGADAAVGASTVICANAVIGPGVQIGQHCIIGPGSSVHFALLGDHVTLLGGARIGESGFGVMPGPNGLEDAPHFGRVILQDYVTVGANACIDRGVFSDTIVGERTKIDNLCQIAHNVVLGRSVIVAAFGGISGSVRVGDGAMLGGRVGIADHVSVGEGVSLAASAGLFRDVGPGETWGGTPAKPIRQWMREVAWLNKQVSGPKKPD